jgi:hypothetical protein
MAKHPVPFSWSAVLLAPLVIPVPAGVLFAGGSAHPVAAFGLGALVGYLLTLAGVYKLSTSILVEFLFAAKIFPV